MTTLNRRGFFRVATGAAVAAPVAMKQVASEAGRPSFRGAYASVGAGMPVSDSDPAYIKRELAEQTKRLAGLGKPMPRHERHCEPIIAEHVDGLRSVSRVNKARMMVEAREALEVERERGWCQRSIDLLKERLGPLGDLL